jgi:7,8-dihydropterin-6-yl-methyl-4-(beta-D-ribofuranosyl)aminobenzene 5'-phosphate synthase
VQRGKQNCALVDEFRGSMLSFRIRMVLFANGPEEDAWDCNAKRLGGNLASIEMVHLSHWHQDHSGGMLRAIETIAAVKSSQSTASKPVVVDVDLHPNRPDYRGFVLKGKLVSFPADPTWEEIDKAGAFVSRSSEVQTALDDMFLISRYIRGVTSYETGLVSGIQYYANKGEWKKDAEIVDERFLVVNVKGEGIVIFTSYSHRGVDASKELISLLPGKAPLHAVVGEFHLASNNDEKVKDTVCGTQALAEALRPLSALHFQQRLR